MDEELVAPIAIDVGGVHGDVAGQLTARTLAAVFIENQDAGQPFGVGKMQANGAPTVGTEFAESQPSPELYVRDFRGATIPGPANLAVRAIQGLDRERRLVTGGRRFGDNDLGPVVSVEIGDGELARY